MTSKNYPHPCKESRTNADKDWPYNEYYIGERDKEGRKTGPGQYFWSGAESLECYTGTFLRDTKHGVGQYNCRHRGTEDSDLTWEGHYYNNKMHGYGLMSYSNGQVFSGLYHSNLRWGPGVETRINLRENVGLWHGDQLVRLTWKPPYASVAPDLLSTPIGVQIVSMYRTILKVNVKTVGEINPALELLKQYGAPPLVASNKWVKLYPNNCTDDRSQFFYADGFDRDFYGSKILTLETINTADFDKNRSQGSMASETYPEYYYAWNNNTTIKHIMNHCYQHDFQMKYPKMNLEKILNGPRSYFKPAAQEELDCRAFLMACYLGHIKNVSQLINEYDVHPNVTDMQGNSGMMYAVCGNQTEIIQFLMEAGGLIDDYNDACCTPLGAALLNFACTRCDVPPSQMLKAILPLVVISSENIEISEWKIERISAHHQSISDINNKPPIVKAPDGTQTLPISGSSNNITKKESKLDALISQASKPVFEPVETLSDDNRLYINLLNEFTHTLKELYEATDLKSTMPVSYIFEVCDMVAELNSTLEEEQQVQLQSQKKGAPDKKDAKNISRELNVLTEAARSMSAIDPMKIKHLNGQMKTIKLLLDNGADPCRVNCPQSALFIAIAAQSSELVELLIQHGADTNEKHPDSLGYSSLEIAVSRPLTQENLAVIDKLLECGSNAKDFVPIANHLMPSQSSVPELHGPTLLNIALVKKVDEAGEKNYNELLKLLLHYGCDPIAQYQGSSAMERAMTKSMEVFNIFIESPNTDLNAAINISNQTILIKMFSMSYCKTIPIAQRLQMLTFLLLYGADPLLKCQNADILYDNLFVYIKQVEADIISFKPPLHKRQSRRKKNLSPTAICSYLTLISPTSAGSERVSSRPVHIWNADINIGILILHDLAATHLDERNKGRYKRTGRLNLILQLFVFKAPQKDQNKTKQEKQDTKKKENPADIKASALNNKGYVSEDLNDFIQTLCLVRDCSRILYIRWIQATLMKEIIELTDKYKHRNWTILLKEYKKGKQCGLWLTPTRCLEIWDILKSTKQRVYDDRTVLKSVLYIVQFHYKKQLKLVTKISAEAKTAIEAEVRRFTREHASNTNLEQVTKRVYVRPELTRPSEVNKFNICFECALPLKADKITCTSCKLVSFCTLDCIRNNIDRINCHPCSGYLMQKYFPPISLGEATPSENLD